MNTNSSLALAVTAGAALVGGTLIWKLNSQGSSLESDGGIDLGSIARTIDIEMVGGLLKSEDTRVRKSAELFLIHRASKRVHLVNFLKASLSDDVDEVMKAITVIHFLSKHSDELKDKLIDLNVVKILVSIIETISSHYEYSSLIKKVRKDIKIEKILSRTIGAMFQMVFRNSTIALQFCSEDLCIKNIFLNIIEGDGFYISMDVIRWTTYMLHELVSLGEKHSIKKSLLEAGLVSKVTSSLIMSLGRDTYQTHICLQIIVQLMYDSVQGVKQVCEEMLSHRILPHLVGLLQCEEDDGILQLSAIVIHHFCCLEMEVEYLCAVPSMVKILFHVLNNSNALIQKVIVRICNYLIVASKKFHKILIEYQPLIKRLSVCLSSGNADVVFGTLMLVHDLIMQGKEFAFKVINTNPDILKAIVKLSLIYSGEIIPETLCLICSSESLHFLILKCGVLEAIFHFAKIADCEVKFWGSALLLNLSMISDQGKEAIIRSGGVRILLEMAVCGEDLDFNDICVNATKTLVMIGFLDATISFNLVSGLEGSIIIDGTERCPGKQGINYVVFDLIKFQFKKGMVIKPSDLVASFENGTFSASDCIAFVTQGDCALSTEDTAKMKKFVKGDYLNFSCPSWCMILMPFDTITTFGNENLQLSTEIYLRDLLGSVLEENFTDPLIGVILSIPPSAINTKLDELALIDILARHYRQRRVIVRTSRFLEHLFELMWNVALLKPNEYGEEMHKRKVMYAIFALKIILSCCNEVSMKELINRGLLQPLIALIQSLTTYRCSNYEMSKESLKRSESEVFTVKDYNKIEGRDDLAYSCDNDNEKVLLTNLSSSQDNIFQPNEIDLSMDTRTSNNVEFSGENLHGIFESPELGRENMESTPRFPSRNRTDSFIVRTDSNNRHNQNILLQRNMSVVSESIYSPGILTSESNDQEDTFSISGRISREYSNKQTPLNHSQLRRLSRSMSLSLQQTKCCEDYFDASSRCDVLDSICKYVSMISYRIIKDSDNDGKQKILRSHLLPFLYGLIGYNGGLYNSRISLALSSSVTIFSSESADSSPPGLFVYSDDPKSIVTSSNGLEVSNENWYFETVHANQTVSKQFYIDPDDHPDGWYYEVELYTDGVMQIGWVNSQCKFQPEKGFGVGDTTDSFGFDGARCKIWNGPCCDAVMDNDYGTEWKIGDVVSVLLSWNGQLAYWLNGCNLGITSCSVDNDQLWYPAASLSIDQHCEFKFERSSLRYPPPDGYVTIDEVAKKEKVEEIQNMKTLRTLDEIFTEGSTILVDPVDTYVAYYYEIDMLKLPKYDEITLGYDICITKETQKLDGSYTDETKQEKECVLEVVKLIPSTILIDGKEKKVKTLGCGILSTLHFIITMDGKQLFRLPIEHVNIGDIFFNTIPHISKSYLLVNYGRNEFQYEYANNTRQTFVETLCSLKYKMEHGS